MIAFRGLLLVIFLALLAYTAVVAGDHGLNLLPIFFADIARMEWQGQFNLDFLFMLTLSGLWVAWRHGFSGAGLALGVAAFFGGALFLSVYLIVQSFRVESVRDLLVGARDGHLPPVRPDSM
jgi:hypothetical protein